MKAFVLMSAAWLSGAGGDPTTGALPTAAPIVSSAPTGACCNGTAPVVGAYTPAIQSSVIPGTISGSCACDPCAQSAPVAGYPAASAPTAGAPASAPAASGHLFHRLFGKVFKKGQGHGHGKFGSGTTAAPIGAAAAAPASGGACGCGSAPEAAPAPASGGLFSRFFGGQQAAPAPAPAPVSYGTVTSGTPCCGTSGGYISGAPATAVIQGVPYHQPTNQPYPIQSYPGVLPGTTIPQTGLPQAGSPLPGSPIPGSPIPGSPMPLPSGTPPEGIKEAPQDSLKLPANEPKFQPTSGTRTESEGRNPFDYHHRQQAQFGCAADYSSMTGRLGFVHVDGGLWVLRYAPLDRVDANGGSVVLGSDRRLENYREGDVVTVQGTIVSDRASVRLAAPLYRMDTIQFVERPTN